MRWHLYLTAIGSSMDRPRMWPWPSASWRSVVDTRNPSFCSTRAARIYVLNDLYVEPSHRKAGVGRLLLQGAAGYAQQQKAICLTLSTAHTNVPAKRLYESLGWKLDEKFRTYTLPTGE